MSDVDNMPEELKNEILKSNPNELLQLITITGSLPQNKKIIPRLETLFKLIVSLSEDTFQNNAFNEMCLQNILLQLSKIYDWNMIEDYDPISVLDYPAVWVLGRRYRIFPGPNDRSYEHWKAIIRYYFKIKDKFIKKFGYNPVYVIQKLLELQTKLIDVIEKSYSDCKKIDDHVYCPTTELIIKWNEIIKKWRNTTNLTFYDNKNIKFGELKILQLIELEPVDSIYKFFSVGEKSIQIFPHTFHGFLSTTFANDHHKINIELQEDIIKNSKYELIKRLCLFFPKENIVPEFSTMGANIYDFAVFFDINKLFLFKILHLDFINDVKFDHEKIFSDLQQLEQKIAEGYVTFYYKDMEYGKIPHNTEVIPIILFETTKVNINFLLPHNEYVDSKHMWCGLFMDFLSVLEELDDFMRFLKFIRREKIIRNEMLIHTESNLDLLAHYLQNFDSFLISGKIPHMMAFMPGCWDKFKVKQIKKRPDFQARHNESEEDDFWDVKVINDSLFHVRNLLYGTFRNIFLLPSKKSIWIISMINDVQYNEHEIHCISLLSELIPYRFINNNILDNLLQYLSIPNEITIRFVLMSTKTISEQNIKLMLPVIPLITSESPMIVRHLVTPEGTLIFYVIYSPEYFMTFLEKEPLEGEKYVLKQILNEICIYTKSQNKEGIVSETLDKLYQNALPAFSFTRISLNTSNSTSLTNYPSTLESDRSEITRMIAEFLTTIDISPKSYEIEDAKEILNKIYEFLSLEFIQRISAIEQTTLLCFLSQSEGQIIKDRILHQKRAKNESKMQMENDSLKQFAKKNQELNMLGKVYRYSIEMTMKHWSEGVKKFTLEDWLELQAMAEYIIICSTISSHLYYKLGTYEFQIFDDYSFNIKSKHVTELEKFFDNFNDFFVLTEKHTVNYNSKESADQIFDDLNEPFEDEFRINIRNLFHVMKICLLYLDDKKQETRIVTNDDLHKFCKKLCPEISLNMVSMGLNALSLTKENMNHNFYPLDVRNRQYRYACKPILKFANNEHYLLNSWSICSVLDKMLAEFDQGYLLYNDNFIKSEKLLKHLKRLRHKASSKHEKTIYDIFIAKTNFVELNIKKNNLLLNDIDEVLPGEIDILAFFKNTKEVYLIEAKNIKMNYAPRDMSNELQKFMKTNGYIDKFNGKIQFVKKHLSKILENYKILDQENWVIKSYFVTSNVSFPQDLSVEYQFITLHDLQKMISDY